MCKQNWMHHRTLSRPRYIVVEFRVSSFVASASVDCRACRAPLRPRSPAPVTAAPPYSAARTQLPVLLPVSAVPAKPCRDFASVLASAPAAPNIKPMSKQATNRAEDDDGFVTVQRRKRRPQNNKNRCGKAPTEPNANLRAAKPNTPVYISRLHYTTKADDIAEYVRQKTRYMPRVVLLESRRNVNFKAFVVRVPNCFLPLVMEEDFWPQGVVFRRFRGQVPQDSTKTICAK